jgi:hypothetical protein
MDRRLTVAGREHLVRRAHTTHLETEGLTRLASGLAEGEPAALSAAPLAISAASALGDRTRLTRLRELPGLPPREAAFVGLELMLRTLEIDEPTVVRFIAARFEGSGVRQALGWIAHVRKSSLARRGSPPPAATLSLTDADPSDLVPLGRLLALLDEPTDLALAVSALEGPPTARVRVLEHCASLLALQAELNLFAPDRARSAALARRLELLLETGAVRALTSDELLLPMGFAHLFAGDAGAALALLTPPSRLRPGLSASLLEAQACAALGDFPRALRVMDSSLRALFASPPSERDPASRPLDPALAGAVLRDVNGVLRRAGLSPFIMSGTLLGFAREGGILKHDKDFDIGLIGWESQYAAAEALLKSRRYFFDPSRLTGRDLFCMPVTHMQSGLNFDLFIYHDKGDHYLHGIDFLVGYTLNFRWTKFGLQEVDFLGDKFYAPADIDLNMTENYGPAWRTPDPGYHVKLEAPAIAQRASHVVNFLAHLGIAEAISKRHDLGRMNRLADICEHLLTPGFRPADDLIARLRKGVS